MKRCLVQVEYPYREIKFSPFFFCYVFKVSTNQRAPTIRSLCTYSISHWSHPFLDHFTLQLLADHLLLWRSGVS